MITVRLKRERQKKRPPLVEKRTRKTQIKMGRSTPQKILMLEIGSADENSIQRMHRQNQTTHRTIQVGYNWHKTEKMERKRTRVGKDKSGSSSRSSMKNEEKRKATATFQEPYKVFWLKKKEPLRNNGFEMAVPAMPRVHGTQNSSLTAVQMNTFARRTPQQLLL